MTLAQSEPKIVYKIAPGAQAIFFRRRHQPRRPSEAARPKINLLTGIPQMNPEGFFPMSRS